jgi:N-glycosylase/DNA lyase
MALWSYMRMRSGANAIKIDVRVKRALRELEFPVPDDDHAALMIAKSAAQEVDLPLLVLDQLLWAMGNFDSAKAVTTDWPA